MKKFFGALVLVIMCFCLVLSGCGNSIVGPEVTDNVYGNGGMVVTKGDYVYYADGFVEAKTSDNKLGNVTVGSLYRAKLENGTLTEAKQIVSKIVGFENSTLFIHENSIYFASPSTKIDSTSALRNDLITFFKANLDGSGLKELNTTDTFSAGSFSFTVIDGKAYIIIFDGTTLYKVDSNGAKTILSKDVTGAVIPSTENITNNFYEADEFHKYAYVTKARTEEQFSEAGALGNCLYRVNLKTGDEEVIYMRSGITLTLKSAKNNMLYYTRTAEVYTTDTIFASTSAITKEAFTESNENILSYNGVVGESVCKADGSDLGVVYVNNKKLYFKKTGETSVKELVSSEVTIKCTKGSYVYYVKESAMYRIDCGDTVVKEEKLTGEIEIDTTYADVDETYFYFFGKTTYTDEEKAVEGFVADTNNHLYRTSLASVERATSEEEIVIEEIIIK